MSDTANAYGKTDEEMFNGIEKPEISSGVLTVKNAKDARDRYADKLIECLLHWNEELRNLKEMTADYEAIPIEERTVALKREKEIKALHPNKRDAAWKDSPIGVRKAMNFMVSLPEKKMDVLKAKRATEHTERVLADCDAILAQRYGSLLQ